MSNLRKIAEPDESPIQLITLKYFSVDPDLRCGMCESVIRRTFYQINGQVTVCRRCRSACAATKRISPALAFLNGTVFGAAAGFVGCSSYLISSELGQYRFFPIVLVMGWFIGKAVSWGTRRRTGWFYQAMAAIITYLAVVGMYVPDLVAAMYAAWQISSPTLPESVLAVFTAWGYATVVPFWGWRGLLQLLCIATSVLIAWRLNAVPPHIHVMGPYHVHAPRRRSRVAA